MPATPCITWRAGCKLEGKMLREGIKKDIIKAISNFPSKTRLASGGKIQISNSEVEVTRTSDPGFGDFTTNIALKVTKLQRDKETRVDKVSPGSYQRPMEFAKVLSDSLKKSKLIKKLEVKEPGFINLFVQDDYWQNQVDVVLKADSKYGSNSLGKGKKARVEFVSANPTGPLHFGNARGGPIGDTIASVLKFCGWQVLREYIDNDRGNQVLELGKTLAAAVNLIKIPQKELVYQGEYTKDLGEKVKSKIKDIKGQTIEQISQKAGEIGVRIIFEEIIADCKAMGITYDLIVHESDLQKEVAKVLSELEKKGFLKKRE